MRAAKDAAAGRLRLPRDVKQRFRRNHCPFAVRLALLEVRRGEHRFTAAGAPWCVGLFGRDSLLSTIQCLAFNPDLGARTEPPRVYRRLVF